MNRECVFVSNDWEKKSTSWLCSPGVETSFNHECVSCWFISLRFVSMCSAFTVGAYKVVVSPLKNAGRTPSVLLCPVTRPSCQGPGSPELLLQRKLLSHQISQPGPPPFEAYQLPVQLLWKILKRIFHSNLQGEIYKTEDYVFFHAKYNYKFYAVTTFC